MDINADNIVYQNWLKRYNSLDEATKRKIDELSNAFNSGEFEKFQLIKIKRSNKIPEKGDVFVLQPQLDLFFYGIVINAHIKNEYSDDMYVVAIFKRKTHHLNMDDFSVDYSMLIMFPVMCARHYWTKGLFFNMLSSSSSSKTGVSGTRSSKSM